MSLAALVYSGSIFKNHARVMTGSFGGNARNIESLYLRYWFRTASLRMRSATAGLSRLSHRYG